jgi:hypothetical protein
VKQFFALLAVGAAVATLSAVASGAPPDTTGPPCADIVDGLAGYLIHDPITGEPLSQPVLDLDLFLASPSCASVTYTLDVYASDETTLLATVTGVRGAESVHFTQTFNGVGEPTADLEGLCLVATTSLGRHVADRAPDQGCVTVEPDSSGGVGFQ